ncbi:MAG: hypothetical protein LBB52_05250, partial [Desulfovibrio sp.]|nr:hypothetical protein [Desulfovibrio sp.]
MLYFHSANVRIANSQRAMDECLEIAFGEQFPQNCRVIIVNAALGHKLDKLAEALQKRMPGAAMVGSSCCGVTGRDGVGESMHDIAIMAVSGPKEEVSVSAVREIYGHNSYEKG